MYVIGVAGQAQMGKDTLANKLQEILNRRLAEGLCHNPSDDLWGRDSFAYGVKEVLCRNFGLWSLGLPDMAFIDKWKVTTEIPPGFDMNIRQALQFIGDGFRKIRSSIWVDQLFSRFGTGHMQSAKIVSDVRYINEFRRIKKEGGLNILVARPDKLNDDPNGSEAIIKPYVTWCMGMFYQNRKCVKIGENVRPGHCPVGYMTEFDLFVRNDGTIEDLYRVVEEEIVPFVESYQFNAN